MHACQHLPPSGGPRRAETKLAGAESDFADCQREAVMIVEKRARQLGNLSHAVVVSNQRYRWYVVVTPTTFRERGTFFYLWLFGVP